jgi:hypothetical protein
VRPATRCVNGAHILQYLTFRQPESRKNARDHCSCSAGPTGAMNDDATAGAQLFDNKLNDIAKLLGFSLRVVRPASPDQILELDRA